MELFTKLKLKFAKFKKPLFDVSCRVSFVSGPSAGGRNFALMATALRKPIKTESAGVSDVSISNHHNR